MDVSKLDGLALFDDLPAQERELIAQLAAEVEAPAGKELVHDAALAWDFYVIRSGTADVRHAQSTLQSLGPGDFFGEIGVFAQDRRRTATVVTTSPVSALKLTTAQVRSIADQSPRFAERLRAAAAEREQHLL